MGACASQDTEELAQARLLNLIDVHSSAEVDEKALLKLLKLWPKLLRSMYSFHSMDQVDQVHFPLEVLCRLELSAKVIETAHHYYPQATRRALVYCKNPETVEYFLEHNPESLFKYRGTLSHHKKHKQGDDKYTIPLHELMADARIPPFCLAVMIRKAPMAALKRENEDSLTPLHILCQRDDRHECAVAVQQYLRKCPRVVVMKGKGGYTPLWYLLADPVLKIPLPLVRPFLEEWPDLLFMTADSGKTPLEMAVLSSRLDRDFVQCIARAFPDAMTRPFRSGRTLLHMACVLSSPKNISLILEAGPQALVLEDDFGETPLALACAHQPMSVVDSLLKLHPENLYKCNNYGYNPLFAACLNQQDENAVEFLLERAPHLVHKRGEFDAWLPLLYACCHGASTQTVQALIRFHPKAVLDVDDDRRNPLHMACMHGYEQTVDMLIRAQSGLLARRDLKSLWIPLHTACYHNAGYDTIKQLLQVYPQGATEQDKDGRTPLHLACREVTNLQTIESVLDCHPAAMRMRDNMGRTPLHLACRNELDEQVVRLLLTKDNFSTRLKTVRHQWTPLHYACFFDAKTSAIKLLMDAYPDALVAEDLEGMTPFQLACKRSLRVSTIEMLLEANPDFIKGVDSTGRSVLHLACQNKEMKAFDICKLLIQKDPSLVHRTTPNERWYPLHHACYHNTSIVAYRLVEYIMNKHPDAGEEQDADGRTPLHLACRNKSPDCDEIVRLLVQEYPMLLETKRSKDGWLPLHYACYYNASFESVRHIFNAYPPAAKEEDAEHQTPLQWAWIRHDDKKLIELMICQLYPEALFVQDTAHNRRFLKRKIRAEARMRGISLYHQGQRDLGVTSSLDSSNSKRDWSTTNASQW